MFFFNQLVTHCSFETIPNSKNLTYSTRPIQNDFRDVVLAQEELFSANPYFCEAAATKLTQSFLAFFQKNKNVINFLRVAAGTYGVLNLDFCNHQSKPTDKVSILKYTVDTPKQALVETYPILQDAAKLDFVFRHLAGGSVYEVLTCKGGDNSLESRANTCDRVAIVLGRSLAQLPMLKNVPSEIDYGGKKLTATSNALYAADNGGNYRIAVFKQNFNLTNALALQIRSDIAAITAASVFFDQQIEAGKLNQFSK